MNRLASFSRKYHFSVRELAELCDISKSTAHRLVGDHPDTFPDIAYLERIEPQIRDACRGYLHSIGKDESEIPDSGFLPVPQQFSREIIVPSNSSANYVFKDRSGKLLAVQVFNI